MTARVEFHTAVADPIAFACRLLRKAYRGGARVIVTLPSAQLAELDRDLWTFAAQEFIAHAPVRGASLAVLQRTPIWLAAELPPGDLPPVLVNLGCAAPASGETFERIIEIVAADAEASQAARSRWRHYTNWGTTPVHHPGG